MAVVVGGAKGGAVGAVLLAALLSAVAIARKEIKEIKNEPNAGSQGSVQ